MSDASASSAVAAAWFADPTNPSQWRWWDGSRWTEHVAPMAAQGASGTEAAAVASSVEAEEADPRWRVPGPETPLLPREGGVPALGSVRARMRSAMLRGWPRLIVPAIASVVIGMFDGMVASNARRWNPLDPTAIDNDVADSMMSSGPSMLREESDKIRDEARDRYWDEAFAALGLDGAEHRGTPLGWRSMRMMLPVLSGPSDVNPRWMRRSELRGFPAWWGEMVVIEAENRRGVPHYARRMRRFVAFEIPPMTAQRHQAVSVGPRPKFFRRSRFGFDEAQFESIAVSEQLTVHVRGGSDPVAARELFGPQLVARLAERPVYWDQRYEHLLVFDDGPAEPLDGLEGFLESAVEVARAYWSDQL